MANAMKAMSATKAANNHVMKKHAMKTMKAMKAANNHVMKKPAMKTMKAATKARKNHAMKKPATKTMKAMKVMKDMNVQAIQSMDSDAQAAQHNVLIAQHMDESDSDITLQWGLPLSSEDEVVLFPVL